MLSGGYGRYENWGLWAAVSHLGHGAPLELTLDLGDDPSRIGEFAWHNDTASGISHPVGQKESSKRTARQHHEARI